MMAKARESKETEEKKQGVFKNDGDGPIKENDEFYNEMKEKADEKYKERQEGKETQIDSTAEKSIVEEIEKELNTEQAKVYDAKFKKENAKGKKLDDQHVPQLIELKDKDLKRFEDIEDVPDLEEVDEEQRRLEEIEKSKEQKQKEWMEQVVKEQELSKATQIKDFVENQVKNIDIVEEAKTQSKEEEDISDKESQKSAIELEDILMDEEKVTAAMKTIS